MLRTHRPILLLIILVWLSGCYGAGDTRAPKNKKEKKPFVFQETIVTGKDTGMYKLGGFRQANIADVLCQHWELSSNREDTISNNLTELDIFKDSTVLKNPRGHIKVGRWRIQQLYDQPLLQVQFSDNSSEQYLIRQLRAHQMKIACKGIIDTIFKTLNADGLRHQNMHNDPFHPDNNRWRMAPPKAENDSAIKARAIQCIRFYALYFRDNIRRQKKTIDFQGLPDIFEWYHRGIGLPDREEVHSSWVKCFYNREQALKGYDILRDLIVEYEFKWPSHAPNWVYETHAVLEQMYHKLAGTGKKKEK